MRRGSVAATIFWLERGRSGEWRKPAVRVELTDARKEAEAIAAEIGQADDPAVVDRIQWYRPCRGVDQWRALLVSRAGPPLG